MSKLGEGDSNIRSPLPKIEIEAINDDKVDSDKPKPSRSEESKYAFFSAGIIPSVVSTNVNPLKISSGSAGTEGLSEILDSQDSLTATSNGNTPGSSGSSPILGQPMKKAPNDYVFGKALGSGSYSSVYLAKDVKTGKEFAIKVCDKSHIIREKKAESIKREKEVLTILSSNAEPTAPFFVHLYATFQDSHRLYFVLTLANGGELLKYLNKLGCFDKNLCLFYTGEIVQALKHLHKLKICHRDLKPENILLTDTGHILVTDFGSAKILTTTPFVAPAAVGSKAKSEAGSRIRSNSFVGTAQYVSPEVLNGRYSEVGPAADLWALGCIIFQFLTGHPPFQAPNEYLIFRQILSLEIKFPDNFDEGAKDLILMLLKLEPSERLGALDKEMYISIQNHPYFSGMDFETLGEKKAPTMSAETLSQMKIQLSIPSNYEPGFDPRTIAERFFRDDDEPWEDRRVSSDESEGSTKSQPVVTSNRDESETAELLNTLSIESPPRCNSDCTDGAGTGRRFSKSKVAFPSDANERLSRLEEQAKNNPDWHKSVKGNLILKQGIISKRKGLFSRKRMLLLTEGPHLYYCDPNSKNIKGEIPWSSCMKPEAKDFKVFYIHTPHRIYYLEDPEAFALSWCDAINLMIKKNNEDKEVMKGS